MRPFVKNQGDDIMQRILVVDDEKMIRNVIKEYAEFDGFEVTEAEDGMEAVAICRR